MFQDLRFGVRMLLRNPGFTLIAIITLALGIGANTVIFSLVDGILLRRLPYQDPGRLVILKQSYAQKGLQIFPLSQSNFAAFREQNRVFAGIAAYANTGYNLTSVGEPERLAGTTVTGDLFGVLGVQPVLGRTFRAEEDSRGRNNVCVLSYGLWQRRFSGDPQIIGTSLTLNDVPTEVVGVMPPGFLFPEIRTDVWTPLGLNPQSRRPAFLTAVARLKPGIQLSETQAELTALLLNEARQSEEPPPPGTDLRATVTRLHEEITGETKKPLLMLQVAVGLVLLIACANVASLLLARATARHRELAVRCALGATPQRIVRQLLTESLLLALFGAVIGGSLAAWGVRLLNRLPVNGIPRIEEVRISGTVLIFTVAVAVITGLLFGLAPALRARQIGLEVSLREGAGGSVAKRRMNSALVAAQLALSVILLVGAGLLLKSFQRLLAVEAGFQPESVLTARLSLPKQKYPGPPQVAGFYEGLLERVRGLPGIKAAGINSNPPFTGIDRTDGYVVEGHEPARGSVAPAAQIRSVSSGLFQSLGMRLSRGRDFAEADRDGSPLVAIVDETLARQYWPESSPVGKRIKVGQTAASAPWLTIIGVVSGVKHFSLSEKMQPYIYLPHTQRAQLSTYLVISTTGAPATAAPAVREAVRELDPNLPVHLVRPLTELVGRTLDGRRLINMLLVAFALLALVLAAVGVYGVMSLYVSSRTHEFGIRLALGARPGDLLRSVLRQGLLLTCGGAVLGVAGALALTRLIAGLLYEVGVTDPLVFITVPLLLVTVALAACYLPARRATKVDPLVALRHE